MPPLIYRCDTRYKTNNSKNVYSVKLHCNQRKFGAATTKAQPKHAVRRKPTQKQLPKLQLWRRKRAWKAFQLVSSVLEKAER